jgi:hypothetical protein
MKSILWCLVLAGGGDFATGLEAYRQGRFDEALRAFAEAEAAAGPKVPAEIAYDKALAALRAGDLAEAESSARLAADRGGDGFVSLRDFLLGNVAFSRCEAAERRAIAPGSEASAFDAAIAEAEAARDSWMLAAASREDWPEARRNVERALLKLQSLQLRREAAQNRKQLKTPNPRPAEPQPQPIAQKPKKEENDRDRANAKEEEPAPPPKPQVVEPSTVDLRRIQERLEAKDREKQKLRQAKRRADQASVEKDW